MPFHDKPVSPARKQASSANAIVEAWTAKIAEADGFVVVSPEYNHSFLPVLKNALDYVCREWARNPVAFVGYGGTGRARAIEPLRLVTLELQMVPVKVSVNLPFDVVLARHQGQPVADRLAAFDDAASTMLDDFLWSTDALRTARA